MSHPIRPIRDVTQGRIQEMGKIKIGKKQGSQPTSLDHFRFVSRDSDAVRRLAELYGGRPVERDGTFDLETTASSVPVILPPDPLGGTPIYELWTAGGCQRRCDGERATVPQTSGDDVTFVDTSCICSRNGRLECKPVVRLSVILPDVSLGGVWNLKSSSWAAAREMDQMVGLIQTAQARGLVAATLSVERRSQVSGGRTRHFVVPMLSLRSTLAELAAGGTGVALGAPAPAAPALPAGPALISETQRATLAAAWQTADVATRTEVDELLAAHGASRAAVPVALYGDLMDRLVVVEADEL